MKRILSILLALFFSLNFAFAGEGMWIPLLLKKYNIKDMQAQGFKLSADDIYSINQASMKDAVMIFGGGCTAELISNQGLIITNHHCGYSAIQSHSSLQHDYLTDGFWSKNKSEELVNEGLTVTFLVRMEDVTERVLENVTNDMPENIRAAQVKSAIGLLKAQAVQGTHYQARIEPFYFGNQYYLFVEEVFSDVRLVAAPPSAIGKFGGDTDNWMWPRHTGDFSVFRIYAGTDNQPADFSPDNVPYQPKKFFPISLKGVEKGDFTMVFGYPARTDEYLVADAVKLITEVSNPHKIKIRQAKIDIMAAEMEKNRAVRIQYSSKYAGVSNGWKKWIGVNKGLKKFDALAKKQKTDSEFIEWVNKKKKRKRKYGNIMPSYTAIYKKLPSYQTARNYFIEAIYRLDMMSLVRSFANLEHMKESDFQGEKLQEIKARYKKGANRYFKDYYMPLDKMIFEKMLTMYAENVDTEYIPTVYDKIKTEYNNKIGTYSDHLYARSIFADQVKLIHFIDSLSPQSFAAMQADPAYQLYQSALSVYREKVAPVLHDSWDELDRLNRLYMNALQEMEKDKIFYPNANFTLRVAYGKVSDYFPRNGVHYLHYTTLAGIIEKDNPEIYDYRVPQKLKDLYTNKDYGKYGKNGEMPVCFLASNHTSGGNSGSPVINAEGQLIGVNFDRNWEGTMSDIMYDPSQCRNISLDIRYALFLIDKLGGASHLIKEMELVK